MTTTHSVHGFAATTTICGGLNLWWIAGLLLLVAICKFPNLALTRCIIAKHYFLILLLKCEDYCLVVRDFCCYAFATCLCGWFKNNSVAHSASSNHVLS